MFNSGQNKYTSRNGGVVFVQNDGRMRFVRSGKVCVLGRHNTNGVSPRPDEHVMMVSKFRDDSARPNVQFVNGYQALHRVGPYIGSRSPRHGLQGLCPYATALPAAAESPSLLPRPP